MTLFIENVNRYIDHMKIKQFYLSKITGIEKNKLSRILKGTQDETGADMEKISEALGYTVDYFVSDVFCLPKVTDFQSEKVAFYAGEPSEKQEKIANDLIEMLKNIDLVLGAKNRFDNVGRI